MAKQNFVGVLIVLLGLLSLVEGSAVAAHHGTIMVSDARVGATPPGASVAAGYLTLHNTSEREDRLESASSQVAALVEIHETTVTNDIAKMRQLPNGVSLASGAMITLEPGGLHLMLLGLEEPLVEGNSIVVTLHFEHSGEQQVEFQVVAPAGGHPMQHKGSMDHSADHKTN